MNERVKPTIAHVLLNGPILLMGSVKYRMIFAFSLLLIGALSIVQISNYYQFSNEIEHNFTVALNNSLRMGLNNIDAQFLDAESLGISIMAENAVQNALISSPEKKIFSYDIMLRNLSAFFKRHIRAKTTIQKAYIINNQGDVLDTVLNIIPPPILDAIKRGYPGGNTLYATNIYRVLYETTRVDVVSLMRRIYRSSASAEAIGFLVMDIDASVIKKILDSFDLPDGGRLLLLNETDIPIYEHGKEGIFPYIAELTSKISQNDWSTGGSRLITIDGIRYTCLLAQSRVTGWRLAVFIPYSTLMQAARQNRNFTFIVLIFCLVAAIAFSSVIISHVSKPITMVLASMKEIERGNFNSVVNYSGTDEMQQLVDGYNSMIAKMGSLIDRVKLDEEEKRNAELYALQAQINPHFLYNTLNTIRYLAREREAGDIDQITASLINLSRASLDSDKFITIKQELDLVMDYIRIMKIRYEDMFDYKCEIEPNLEMFMIPRFSIQPLVENAIFHGIVPKGKGNITVRVLEKDGGIMVEVEDSGIGIERKQLRTIERCLLGVRKGIIASKVRRSMKNIGLVNIDNRIKMYFSPAYGLCIESHPGTGTRVQVSIPKRHGSEAEENGYKDA